MNGVKVPTNCIKILFGLGYVHIILEQFENCRKCDTGANGQILKTIYFESRTLTFEEDEMERFFDTFKIWLIDIYCVDTFLCYEIL